MFTLSKEQYQAFCRCQEDLFIDKLTRYLGSTFPEQTQGYSRIELEAIARHAVEKARSYGITNQDDICRYLNFMIIYGFNFDQDIAWVHDILTDFSPGTRDLRIQELSERFLTQVS